MSCTRIILLDIDNTIVQLEGEHLRYNEGLIQALLQEQQHHQTDLIMFTSWQGAFNLKTHISHHITRTEISAYLSKQGLKITAVITTASPFWEKAMEQWGHYFDKEVGPLEQKGIQALERAQLDAFITEQKSWCNNEQKLLAGQSRLDTYQGEDFQGGKEPMLRHVLKRYQELKTTPLEYFVFDDNPKVIAVAGAVANEKNVIDMGVVIHALEVDMRCKELTAAHYQSFLSAPSQMTVISPPLATTSPPVSQAPAAVIEASSKRDRSTNTKTTKRSFCQLI